MLQQNVDLHSTVIQMERRNILSHYCRIIVDTLICSEFEGKNGIKSTTEKAMGNVAQINVERSAVLRQYYGKTYKDVAKSMNSQTVRRATYAVGCGSASVGTDPHNYVTRDMSSEMMEMGKHLIEIQRNNINLLNLQDVNLNLEYNHCTILLYYCDEAIKDKASIGMHCDCTYSPITKKYEDSKNSQVENTTVATYSIGDMRKLQWIRRKSCKGDKDKN